MEQFKNFNFKQLSIPKLIGLLVIGIILFVVVISLFSFAFRVLVGGQYGFNGGAMSSPQYAYDDASYAMEEAYYDEKLSVRNVMPPLPGSGNTTGSDGENFEITNYNGSYKSSNVEKTCTAIEDLKPLEYVIFENANRYERGCNYSFKVENSFTNEILAILEDLNPEELNQNTHTIKNLVDDYTSEIEILENKLESVEETLTQAQASYDQVEILATRTQDVESLAKIIDSKVGLIERLTQERIQTKEQIDRINRSKAEQLDKLSYTFFSVNVYEDKIVDFERIVESWKWELKRVVSELSGMLQALSTGLLVFIFKAIPIAIYLIVALFILKYGWRGAKYMWRK